ncbi:Predicted membrane protein [Rothia dentocariosa]|jgi:hypothetical protein|uniref:Predicted membrane protein n=1 Tax=Rothia dentocariosa TaxID=2047 RepID=A0A3S4YM91_9MICC|nr:Predicted membrane protein [Rothia dentocariosa]
MISSKKFPAKDKLAIGSILRLALLFFVILHPAALLGVLWTVTPVRNAQSLHDVTPIAWVVGASGCILLMLQPSIPSKHKRARVISFVLLEGLFLGGFVTYFENIFPGVMLQLSFATFSAFIGALCVLSLIKAHQTIPQNFRVLLVALVGYGSFILHNIGVSNLNFPIIKPWGIGPSSVFAVPIGLVLALLLIPLSAYTLVAKVDRIKHILVTDKTDTTYIWESALGLIFTVVWPLTKNPREIYSKQHTAQK